MNIVGRFFLKGPVVVGHDSLVIAGPVLLGAAISVFNNEIASVPSQ